MRRIRLRAAHKVGVRGIVSSSVGPTDWDACIALSKWSESAQTTPLVFAALGIHPYAVSEDRADNDRALEALAARLAKRPPVVALGECGLDFRRQASLPLADRDEQLRVCARQLELAAAHDLPVVLHCVRAHGPLLELLESMPVKPSVLHAYSGSPEHLDRLLALGHYASFAAKVMLNDAKKIHASVRRTPAERLLIETDSPDQAPPHRPSPNEPAYLVDVARAVADLRKVPLASVAQSTLTNAMRVYGLNESG